MPSVSFRNLASRDLVSGFFAAGAGKVLGTIFCPVGHGLLVSTYQCGDGIGERYTAGFQFAEALAGDALQEF